METADLSSVIQLEVAQVGEIDERSARHSLKILTSWISKGARLALG